MTENHHLENLQPLVTQTHPSIEDENMRDFLGLDTETPSERRARVLADSDSNLLIDLVAMRKAKGVTQTALAERMGVTQATVASFERYDSDPKLSTIRRYAHALEAIVSHTVEHDNGQNVGSDSSLSKTFSMKLNTNFTPSAATYAVADSKRTDFALAG